MTNNYIDARYADAGVELLIWNGLAQVEKRRPNPVTQVREARNRFPMRGWRMARHLRVPPPAGSAGMQEFFWNRFLMERGALTFVVLHSFRKENDDGYRRSSEPK